MPDRINNGHKESHDHRISNDVEMITAEGITPVEYIQQVRVQAAKKYLIQTNKSDWRYRHMCGYG
jgi:methylphosphotriester-DNA--protein-cysteine methyltransferase